MLKNGEILVMGHRNPDTDAICSAVGYAEFKRRTGMEHAVAARCGATNDRIDYVLKTFGVKAPRLITDVSPKVSDVMQKDVIFIGPDANALEAMKLLDDRNVRVLPVLNEDRECLGLVSVFKMSQFFFVMGDDQKESRRVVGSVANLNRTLGGELIHAHNPDQEEDLILMIGAMSPESFSRRLANYENSKLIVVVGDRLDIQILAVQSKVQTVIVTGGHKIESTVLNEAKRNGVNLVRSQHDTATTAMLCRGSIGVRHLITSDCQMLEFDEPLTSAQRKAAASHTQAFPVIDDAGKVVGILSKSDFLKKVRRQLILVDHNELSQAVHGAGQVEILEIIDHHRIGNFTSQQPILFRNEPVGSTSTIVADCFFRYQVELPKPIAGLLLAGVVSDTLNLTSPTSTDRDAEILKRLEAITEINAAEFTDSLFASGSVLTSSPAGEAINADCKEYHEKARKFSVAQIEEIGFDQFWKRKEEVMKALEEHRNDQAYFFAALMVTDVVKQNSLLLVSGAKAFIEKIDYPEMGHGIYQLNGVVSRKKQLLPYLVDCLVSVKEGEG